MPVEQLINRNLAPNHELQSIKESDFGAFLQVLQKIGPNISYVTYGLPKDIAPSMLSQMMTGILYPEDHFRGDARPQEFAGGDLQILARPGIHIDAIDRMLVIPKGIIDANVAVGNQEPSSKSMLRYRERYGKMQEELGGIKENFLNTLFAAKAEAKVADGVHIYDGAYKFDSETGNVLGWDLFKTREFDLRELPNDEGHVLQIDNLVELLQKHDNVIIVLTDKSKTVGDCFGSCSQFFEMKEQEGINIDQYTMFVIAPSIFGGEQLKKLAGQCSQCGESSWGCDCKKQEVVVS